MNFMFSEISLPLGYSYQYICNQNSTFCLLFLQLSMGMPLVSDGEAFPSIDFAKYGESFVDELAPPAARSMRARLI